MKKTTKKYSLIALVASLIATMIGAVTVTFNASATATVETSRFEMVEGASIRTVAPKGLRFIAEMGADVYQDLTTVESDVVKKMGMFIVPSAYLNDSSKYSNGVRGVMEKSYEKITKKIDHVFYSSDGSVENKIYKSDDYYRANGVISNLLLKNYDKDFIGIAYVSKTVNGQTTYTYADFNLSDNVRDSIYVAAKAYEDYTDTDKRAVFNEYVMGAHLESLGMTETVTTENGVRTVTYDYDGESYANIQDVAETVGCAFTLTLDEQNLFIYNMDETPSLTATVSDRGVPVTIDTYITWKSANQDIVSVDENGNLTIVGGGETSVSATFLGQTASCNVTVFDGTFETVTSIPTFMKTTGNAGTATIGEKDGDKCLVIPVTGASPRLQVSLEFLASYFADPNVQYVAFDAKTDNTKSKNFRRRAFNGTTWTYVRYEYDNDAFGITNESWKSFYFTRKDYEDWVSQGVVNDLLIYADQWSTGVGDNIYVDNIRPLTEQEHTDEIYSFEEGYMKLNSTNLLAYNNIGAVNTWQLGIGFNAAANAPTAFGLTNERASNGMRALSFTKPANTGDYTVRLNDAALTQMKSTGYYAFDLYIPEGADTTLISGDATNSTYTIQAEAGGWTTVYVSTANVKPVNIHDTTGGTYAIDHFRSVTAEEFENAIYGLEKCGGISDKISSANRFFYCAASDWQKGVWSLNFKGDGATISDPHFNTDVTHSGNYSIAFTKTIGYMFMSINKSSAMYKGLENGFTFWIYSTVALNGTGDAKNFINGAGKQFGTEGVLVQANTWTQITITAEDINDNGRYLQIQGSTAGTIYFDDYRPIGEDNGESGDGSGEQVTEKYLSYKADFDETQGGLILQESSHSGSAASVPNNNTDIVEDMSYFAFNQKFGLNDFLVFDITGDNMPIISFFNNEVTKTIYNQEQDVNVKGWIIANGLTLNNGALYGGIDGAHANRLAVIGANKIAYKFDQNGATEDDAVQFRFTIGSAASPWGLSMSKLQSSTDPYKVVIGFTENKDDANYIILHVYAMNMSTGQAVVNTSVSVRALYEEGYIAMHGHFGRKTVVDKVYPIEQDTTLQAIINKNKLDTLVYNGAWDGEGGLVLGTSSYTGNADAPATADMSYIAFDGKYGLGDYVVFDFTGDNMPWISFFNNTITNTAFNIPKTDGAVDIKNGVVDTTIKAWTITNGLKDRNGAWVDNSEGTHSSRVMVMLPHKITGYTSDNSQSRYVFNGAAGDPSVLSMRTLETVTDTYRMIVGAENDNGNPKIRMYVINMITGEVVMNRTQTYAKEFEEGSIILYGRFHKETVLDKMFGVEEDTNINELLAKYNVARDVDYSDETASFDAYAYSGPTNGQWTIDGKNQEANPTDFRTVEHLTTYKNAGFNIYLAQNSITVDAATWETDGKVIMDRAYEAGLKVILTDSRIQTLSEPVTVSEDGIVSGTAWEIGEGKQYAKKGDLDSYLANCLNLYKDHPAFYGVMLGDEPSYHNAYCYGEVYKALKRVMPEIYVQYNLLPLNSIVSSIKYRYPGLSNQGNSLSQSQIETGWINYLTMFIDSMGVDYIQYDDYPMKSESTGVFIKTDTPYVKETYLRGLQIVGEIAKERSLSVKVVSQTCVMRTSGQSSAIYYRQITEDDARWINNSLLGFGIDEISYFTYWTKQANSASGEWYDDGGSFVKRDGTTTEVYTFMKTIMAENQSFAGTIKNFDYMGSRVYSGNGGFGGEHVSWLNSDDYSFRRITKVTVSTDTALVTELYDSQRYNHMYMLMNTIDPSQKNNNGKDTSQNITVTFDSGCTRAYVYKNGERSEVTLTNNAYTFTLTAGEAVYVLPY